MYVKGEIKKKQKATTRRNMSQSGGIEIVTYVCMYVCSYRYCRDTSGFHTKHHVKGIRTCNSMLNALLYLRQTYQVARVIQMPDDHHSHADLSSTHKKADLLKSALKSPFLHCPGEDKEVVQSIQRHRRACLR